MFCLSCLRLSLVSASVLPVLTVQRCWEPQATWCARGTTGTQDTKTKVITNWAFSLTLSPHFRGLTSIFFIFLNKEMSDLVWILKSKSTSTPLSVHTTNCPFQAVLLRTFSLLTAFPPQWLSQLAPAVGFCSLCRDSSSLAPSSPLVPWGGSNILAGVRGSCMSWQKVILFPLQS